MTDCPPLREIVIKKESDGSRSSDSFCIAVALNPEHTAVTAAGKGEQTGAAVQRIGRDEGKAVGQIQGGQGYAVVECAGAKVVTPLGRVGSLRLS